MNTKWSVTPMMAERVENQKQEREIRGGGSLLFGVHLGVFKCWYISEVQLSKRSTKVRMQTEWASEWVKSQLESQSKGQKTRLVTEARTGHGKQRKTKR
jgi:hypothetical protein